MSRSLAIIGLAAVLLAGCQGWQENITLKGVAFERARVERDGLIIGLLKEDTIIAGHSCRRGWVHLHTNGVPSAFTAARPIDRPGVTVPAGTWVIQNSTGVLRICAFPRDTMVQGHLCRGGAGGSAGVQAAFYPSGALKQYYLRRDKIVQGVPCEAGLLNESIELHENGQLKACVLSKDFSREGHIHKKGTRIRLDPIGRLDSPK